MGEGDGEGEVGEGEVGEGEREGGRERERRSWTVMDLMV